MEDVFKFSVLVNEMDKVEVEIPQTLRHEVGSKYVGKMERFEFGFHFFEVVERDYPELHNLILQSIDRKLWLNASSIYYSLCSDWFEDKT